MLSLTGSVEACLPSASTAQHLAAAAPAQPLLAEDANTAAAPTGEAGGAAR